MELVQYLVAVLHKACGGAVAWEVLIDFYIRHDAAGVGLHDEHPGTHIYGLVYAVGDHEGELLPLRPYIEYFVLHVHAGERVQGAQRLVQQAGL